MKKVYAYTHTHWDREWYQPFETFRLYLVKVLKQILEDLESDKLSRFYLDGQAIILDDALAIAPELAGRVKAMMEKGELAAGPWYVMPDEMLVSGESLVRNLKLGVDTVKKFGKPELVGYSPDTFGHSQDLPRILNGFGIRNAILWRGVPQLSYGPCFWWKSSDGSQVLAYHLSKGYYQTSLTEKVKEGLDSNNLEKLKEELQKLVDDKSQWDNPSLYDKTPDLLLYPIGADHSAPPRDLNANINLLNQHLKNSKLEIETVHLGEFVQLLEAQAKKDFALVGMVSKELRDNAAAATHANAYILQGVLSTRLYLKRENREAERRLFRMIEPLLSILQVRKMARYPHQELEYMLKLLLKNHPHDSICGCSVDAVHDEMMSRSVRFHQVADALLDEARCVLSGLSASSASNWNDPDSNLNRLRVINSSARTFRGVVPFSWFEKLEQPLSFGASMVQIEQTETVDQLFSGWGQVPYYKLFERKDAWVWIDEVEGLAEANFAWPLQNVESKFADCKVKGKTLDNGILEVFVDDKSNLAVVFQPPVGKSEHYILQHLLRDTADGGDTYNFDPVLGDKPSHAKLVSVAVGRKGPLVASLLLSYEIEIPEAILEDKAAVKPGSIANLKRSKQKIKHEIQTEVILKKGSRMLEFETTWQNRSSGHRLELFMSTGSPVHCSFSENHFSLVRRYHQMKGEPELKLPVEVANEAPCDRYPAQRFVVCNKQLFLNKGLPEYGVDGDGILLTLLRSVPILSRGRMQTRGGGAGPHVRVDGANCFGLNKVSYGWAPLWTGRKTSTMADSLDDLSLAEAYDCADAYEQEPFLTLSSINESACHSLIKADTDVIKIVGLYVSEDAESLFVRIMNTCNQTFKTKIFVDFDFKSAHLCRFDEEVGEEVFLYRDYVKTRFDAFEERDVCALEMHFLANEVKTVKFRLEEGVNKKAASTAAVAVAESKPKRKRASKKQNQVG